MAVAQPGTSCTSLFKQLEILPVSCESCEFFKQIHQYTILKQGVSIIFIDLSCFQKSTFYVGMKIFSNLPCSLTILKNEKSKFKVAIRKYFNIYFFYSVYEFLCGKMILFYRMFVIYYCKIFVICVNMTCSTSRCFWDTCIQGVYVCTSVLLS